MRILFFGAKYKVLKYLAEHGESKAGDISRDLLLRPSALSHMLLFYKKANILVSEKRGVEIFYKINPELIKEVQELIAAASKIEEKVVNKGK